MNILIYLFLELGFDQKITSTDTDLLVLLPVYISYDRYW
jgi:hypothetical protein